MRLHNEVDFEAAFNDQQNTTKCWLNMFWGLLMTFTCEVKIDLIKSEAHYVKFFSNEPPP